MRGSGLAWPLVLAAFVAPPAYSQTAWKASGSGTDTTLTLEARVAPPRAGLSIDAQSSTEGVARPKLILKCHDRKPMVGIFIGSLNENVATVRFDREPAFKVGLNSRLKWGKLWMTTTVLDPGTMFFDKPAKIAASLLGHKTMLIHLTPANRPSQDVTFNLPKLEPQLADFEQACDLKEPIERPSVAAAAAPPTASSPAPSTKSTKPAAPGLQKFGEWRQSVTTSKIDDRPIVLLSLPEAKGSSSSKPVSLVLRCREQETEAFLSFDLPLFGPRGAYMVVRASADGGAEDKEWWLAPSTDGKAYFFGSTPQILKRLLASQKLRLAYRPRKHPEQYAWMPQGESVFMLAGLDRASKAFLDSCPIDMAKVKVKDGLAKLQ